MPDAADPTPAPAAIRPAVASCPITPALRRPSRPENRVDEFDLIGRARTGDRDACGELYRRYHGALLDVARCVVGWPDCEDVVQNVMERLEDRLRTFDPDRGTFRSWIRTVVRNEARHLARRRRELSVDPAQHAEASTRRDDPEGRVCDREEFRHCLAKVRPMHAKVLWLSAFSTLDDGEIAQVMDIKDTTVRTARLKGRDALVAALEEYGLIA